MKHPILPLLALLLLTIQFSQASGTRWEYRVVGEDEMFKGYDGRKATIEQFINLKINGFGKDGWELIQIDRKPSDTQLNFSTQFGTGNITISSTARYFFKRELNTAEHSAAASPAL